jgi:hypothetical protein
VLFLSLIFCKQEEKLLFFGSISGCTCLILPSQKGSVNGRNMNRYYGTSKSSNNMAAKPEIN